MTTKDDGRSRDIGARERVRYRDLTLYTNSWALVIGIDRYQDEGIHPLEFAEHDAQEVSRILPSLGFPAGNIRLLLASRSEVTPTAILQLLQEELCPQMEPDDRFLLYFSGHGVTAEVQRKQHGYLLMPNTKISGPWPTPERPFLSKPPVPALEMKLILQAVSGLPSKHNLLLIDSCFSGFMTQSRDAGSREIHTDEPSLAGFTSEPVIQVLTAGRSGERAFEHQQYRHGLFTHYVLKGLRGAADPRNNSVITFTDLAGYVKKRVTLEEESEQHPQGAPYYGEGEFLFPYGEKFILPRLKSLILEGTEAFASGQQRAAIAKWGEARSLAPEDAALARLVALAESKPPIMQATRRVGDVPTISAVLNTPRVPFVARQQADFLRVALPSDLRGFSVRIGLPKEPYWRAGFALAPEDYIGEGDTSITPERYFLLHIGRGYKLENRNYRDSNSIFYTAYYQQNRLFPDREFEWRQPSLELDVSFRSGGTKIAVEFAGLTNEQDIDPAYACKLYLLAWADDVMAFRVPVEFEVKPAVGEFRPGEGSELPSVFTEAVQRSQSQGAVIGKPFGPVERVTNNIEIQHFVTKEPYRCCLVRKAGAAQAIQVRGVIYQKYMDMNGPDGFLGLPWTDEQEAAPSRFGTTGRYNHFEHGGEIDYHQTGTLRGRAFEVHGAIGHRYISMGGTGSILGFPISDEHDAPEGRQSDFEGGSLYWRRDLDRVCLLARLLDTRYLDSPFDHDWHRYDEAPEDHSILRLADGDPRYLELRAGGSRKAVSYPQIGKPPGLDLSARYLGFSLRSKAAFHAYARIRTVAGKDVYVACWTNLEKPAIILANEWALPLDKALLDGGWHTIILDLEKEAQAGFQDRFGSLQWLCFRGELDLANVFASEDLELLQRSVLNPVLIGSPHRRPLYEYLLADPLPRCRKGSEGEDVVRIQLLLRGLGLYSVAVDGHFGEATEAAVKGFQASCGLDSDGTVGPCTWDKLAAKLQASSWLGAKVRINPIDGLEYVWIPSGSFLMGCVPVDKDAEVDEQPRHWVTLSEGFWMARAPVTVAAYRRFCQNAGRPMPKAPEFDPDWERADHPVVNVSWEAAQQYCRWAGGRLPTEAEWEYAARGGQGGLIYPWGNALTGQEARCASQEGTAPVASHPSNGFGLCDMAGNVWEWCSDWYDAHYYGDGDMTDPRGPAKGECQVLRGGSWNNEPRRLRVSARNHIQKDRHYSPRIGFRCVQDR